MHATIVIPCYNEAERLDAAAFARWVEATPDVDLLFVDDGSTDDTRERLQALAATHDRMAVLGLDTNGGKAEAVRRGFLAAFEDEPDFVGFWDADLATPLEDVVPFRAFLDDHPAFVAVFGSRVNLLGHEVRRALLRHYIGRVFATLAAFVLGMPVYDTQCGAKLFRTTALVRGVFAEPFISSWIFDVEIMARMAQACAEQGGPRAQDMIFEFPLMSWRDVAGSKLRMKDFVVVARDLVRIYGRYAKYRGSLE